MLSLLMVFKLTMLLLPKVPPKFPKTQQVFTPPRSLTPEKLPFDPKFGRDRNPSSPTHFSGVNELLNFGVPFTSPHPTFTMLVKRNILPAINAEVTKAPSSGQRNMAFRLLKSVVTVITDVFVSDVKIGHVVEIQFLCMIYIYILYIHTLG